MDQDQLLNYDGYTNYNLLYDTKGWLKNEKNIVFPKIMVRYKGI